MTTSDIRIDNAIVVDGTGRPARPATVSISDGILAVGHDKPPAHRVIDVEGAVLAPGFIDLHTHTDFTLPAYPSASSMVTQGVTTHVAGNCGFSPFPNPVARREVMMSHAAFIDGGLEWDRWTDASGYFAYVDSIPRACNIALQVGLGSTRVAAVGLDQRPPTTDEMAAMRMHVAEAFEAGVVGVSSGLVYPPGASADTAEITALVGAARPYGGFYSTHVRNEATQLLIAIEEALTTAEKAGVPLQLSHHKSLGERAWGLINSSLRMIDEATEQGQDVMADQYPYRAGSTGFAQILPGWALGGGADGMRRALDDPDARRRIVRALQGGDENGIRDFDPDGILLAEIPDGPNKRYEGSYLVDVARHRAVDPIDAALDLLDDEGTAILMVVFGMSERDVRTVMAHPSVAIASDGWTLGPAAGGVPHPRNYGTYTRVLGRYVRDEGVLTLEDAIRKMTGLPARRLPGLGRGLIVDGAVADIVVFDADEVMDRSTYSDPHQFSSGVTHVLVNGVPVVEQGEETGASPGVLLRSAGRSHVKAR